MNEHSSQVFQTNTASRWKKFKWTGRLIIFLLVLAAVFFTIAYKNMFNPDIPLESRVMKKFLTSSVPDYRESNLGKHNRGMRKYIEDKWLDGRGCGQNDKPHNISQSFFLAIALVKGQPSM